MNCLSLRIESILTRAEEELRELIGEAGLGGDYEAVGLSRDAAVQIREIRDSLCDSKSVGDIGGAQLEPEFRPSSARSQRSTKKRRKRTGGNSGEYPKFFTRNGTLCKVGWSKKAKKEYLHKVPKDAFDRTVTAITSLSESSKNPFTAEQVVERTEQGGCEVPAYQVYVILALLREKKALHREGREGYIAGGDLGTAAAAAWTSLGG